MSKAIDQAIALNLVLLEVRLRQAYADGLDALAAMRNGKRNLAIGSLLPIDGGLSAARTLLDAIFELHRSPPAGTGQTAADQSSRQIARGLATLRTACEEALSDAWDRSDDGFKAMIESIDDLLAIVNGEKRGAQ